MEKQWRSNWRNEPPLLSAAQPLFSIASRDEVTLLNFFPNYFYLTIYHPWCDNVRYKNRTENTR